MCVCVPGGSAGRRVATTALGLGYNALHASGLWKLVQNCGRRDDGAAATHACAPEMTFPLSSYLARIGVTATPTPDLATLTLLMASQSRAIAFENIDVVLG